MRLSPMRATVIAIDASHNPTTKSQGLWEYLHDERMDQFARNDQSILAQAGRSVRLAVDVAISILKTTLSKTGQATAPIRLLAMFLGSVIYWKK